MLVFEGRGLFCFLGSKKQDIACSKNTYYRFMEDPHYNWRRFITLLAARVTAYFNSLTKPEHRQMYHYHGRLMNLQSLTGYVRYNRCEDIIGSIVVKTRRHSIPVKLVFVRNRNKRNEAIIILSTDISLTPEEIARIYGARWSIECFHKVDKSLLKLGKEYQGLSYDMTVSSTAIVFTRYIILEWLRRKENDQKTIGEILFVCCDDIQYLELSTALASILSLFVEGIRKGTVIITEAFRLQLVNWYVSQPRFIKALFPETLWEV